MPNFVMPDYSLIAQRGQIVAKGIQDAMNIIANTSVQAIEEYKQKRNVETAYSGVRGLILSNQKKYGFDDKQADAMMSKLKYRDGEKIEDYERRIAPTLINMRIWEDYTKDPEYKVDLPNPFLDTQSFVMMLNDKKQRMDDKNVGETVYSTVFGEGGKPVSPELQSTQQLPQPGVQQEGQQQEAQQQLPQTREQATRQIAGRMGSQPVTEQQLQKYPAYRSLPSEADIVQKQKEEELLNRIQAQTESAQALTSLRETTEEIKRLQASKSPKKEVDNLNDLTKVTNLELRARQQLGNMMSDDPSYKEVEKIANLLKDQREKLTQKEGAIKPGMEANQIADKVLQDIQKIYPKGTEKNEAVRSLAVDRISLFAQSKGLQIDREKIGASLDQGNSVADIIERILMASKMQQTKPSSDFQIGGRIGR